MDVLYQISGMVASFGKFRLKVNTLEVEKITAKTIKLEGRGTVSKKYLDKITDHKCSFHNQFKVYTFDKDKIDDYKLMLLDKFEKHYRREKVRVDGSLDIIIDIRDELNKEEL